MLNHSLNYEQRVWLKEYPPGMLDDIDINLYPTVKAYITEMLKKYSDFKGYYNMGKWLTFGQIDKYSDNLAAFFHSRGLVPGDKIAIMLPNLLQTPIAIFAAIKAGLVVVNTNPLYTQREMEHQFSDSDAKAIIIADMFGSKLQQIIRNTKLDLVITTSIGDMLGGIKGRFINFVLKYFKKMVPKFELPGYVTFKEAIKKGKKQKIKEYNASKDDIVFLQYTGGTTGVAKGAELTNKNIVANILQIHSIMATIKLEEKKETVLTALPLYHVFALMVNLMATLKIGAKNVLVSNARDLKSLDKEFKNHKVSIFSGVNTLFNALLNYKPFLSNDFSTYKMLLAGGMALQDNVAIKWREATGTVITEGYGLTECSPLVAGNPVDGTAKIGTIGFPISSTYLRVVDKNYNPVPVGEIGEIQVKGPQVMKRYYNRPDETAKVFKDGWLCTGDIGYMEPNGYFRIVDRMKDMILVSGFNVYPFEVEDVISDIPKVLEVAAVGVPHDKSGEVVKVFIVREDESLTEKQIIDHCRKNLTGYKIPRLIEFREELPKSNVGKILKKALREEKE